MFGASSPSTIQERTTPLLTHTLFHQSSFRKMTTRAKVLTGFVGLGGIACTLIYINPSELCAKDQNCGLWLSDTVGSNVAPWIFYGFTALNYVGWNMCFAKNGFTQLISYILQQPTLSQKILKGGGVIFFSLIENMEPFFVSLGTKAAMWEIGVNVVGSFPRSLSGCIKIVKIEAPHQLSKFRAFLRPLYYRIKNAFWNLTETEITRQNERLHFQKLHALFPLLVKDNWKKTLINRDNLEIDNFTLYEALFDQDGEPLEESNTQYFFRMIFKLLGVIVAIGILTPLLLNTHSAMQLSFPEMWDIIISIMVSISRIYLFSKLILSGFDTAFHVLNSLLTHEPINWFFLQSHTKPTLFIMFLSLITASLSYATIEVVYERVYNGPEKNNLRLLPILSMDIFHYIGILHLYDLILSLCIHNPRDESLHRLENEIPYLIRLPLDDFIAFIQNPRYSQTLEMLETHLEKKSSSSKQNEKSPSESWCSCWSRKKPKITDVTVAEIHSPIHHI